MQALYITYVLRLDKISFTEMSLLTFCSGNFNS